MTAKRGGSAGTPAGMRRSTDGWTAGTLPGRAAALAGSLLVMLGSTAGAHAQNATWTGAATGPFGGQWNNPGNWSGNTVPTGTAKFTNPAAATVIDVASGFNIGTFLFAKNALSYNFLIGEFGGFNITGAGVENTSSSTQLFNSFGGLTFLNNSTAGNAVLLNGGVVEFFDRSTAGSATVSNTGFVDFINNSTAGSATITNVGGFTDVSFFDNSNAGNAIINNNSGGRLDFAQNSTASNAIITNESHATTLFGFNSNGGQAQFITNAGGTVDFSDTAGPLGGGRVSAGSIAGAGNYLLGADQLTVGGNNLSTTVSGLISDGGIRGGAGASLVKVGTGTLTLSGSNTYTGGTTIADGVVQFGQPASIAGTGPNVVVKSTAIAATLYPMDQNFLNRIAPASQGVVALAADSADNLDFNAPGLSRVSLGAVGSATFSGSLTPAGNTYRLGGGGGLTVASPLTGTAGLVVNGNGMPGLVTLTGANSFAGGATVAGGILRAGATGALPAFGAVDVGTGAVFNLNGFSQSIGDLSGNGTVTLGGATLTTGNDNGSTVFSGVISSAGNLVKSGTGTLILTGANDYGGATTISGGTLRTGAANALPSRTAVIVAAGTTFDLDNFAASTGSLAGAGRVALGRATLTTGSDGTDTTFSGVISGAGGLVKTGVGTLTLTGLNTYAGGTTVDAGTLRGDSTSLTGNILDNATVAFDQASSGIFAGSIAGGGTVVKENGGLLVLDGDNSRFVGTTMVAGGVLQVGDAGNPGARLGGDVTVADSTILSGHGTIGGSVANLGGTVMPGGTIGTLTVAGNIRKPP